MTRPREDTQPSAGLGSRLTASQALIPLPIARLLKMVSHLFSHLMLAYGRFRKWGTDVNCGLWLRKQFIAQKLRCFHLFLETCRSFFSHPSSRPQIAKSQRPQTRKRREGRLGHGTPCLPKHRLPSGPPRASIPCGVFSSWT